MDSDLAQVLVSIDATHLESSQNEDDEELVECKPSQESLIDDSSFDPGLERSVSHLGVQCEDLIEKFRRRSVPSVTISCQERVRPNKYSHLPPHPYRCTLCDFTTSDLEVISEHGDVMHQDDMNIICNICSCFKSTLVKVVKHQASEHNKLEFQKYLKFKSSISEADIAAMYIKNDIFSCTLCTFETGNFVKFKTHMKYEHSESLYICSQCDFRACDMTTLRRHISNHHVEIMPYKCPLCDYSSPNTENVVTHADIHKELAIPKGCNLCAYKTQFTKRLRCHVLMHLDKDRFECYMCSEQFDRMVDILKHFKEEHSVCIYRANKCVQCSLTYQFRKDLSEHEYNVHSAEKPYNCSECIYSCNTVKRFAEHCKSIHNEKDMEKLVKFDSNVNPVFIDTLNKFDYYKRAAEDDTYKRQFCSFTRPSSLFAKTSFQKYECKICPFAVSKVALLVTHMENVHSQENGKEKRPNFLNKLSHVDDDSDYVTEVKIEPEQSPNVRTSKRKKSLPAKYQMQHECDICNFQATTFDLLSKHKLVFHKRKINKYVVSKDEVCITEPPCKKEKLTNNSTASVLLDSDVGNKSNALNTQKRNEKPFEIKRKRITSKKCSKLNNPKPLKNDTNRKKKLKIRNVNLEGCESDMQTFSAPKVTSDDEEMETKPVEEYLDCHLCDFKSNRVDVLSTHMFLNHLEMVGKKTCYHCKMQFDDVERLRFHVAITHDENESLICGFCGLSIPTIHLFEAHTAYKHNRLTDIECAHCHSKFRSIKFMKYHLKHHRDEIEKIVGMLFPCAYCPFGAEKFKEYSIHMQKEHPGYEAMKCKFCPYVGTAKSQFRKHLFGKHHKLKEFQCPCCDYCATHKDEMRLHVKRIHSITIQ